MERIGVILAAGRGRRMGGTKQLVPWPTADGAKPLVAAAYDAIRTICDEMIVVLGHEADVVAAALGDRPFHRALANPDAPMFESIRSGMIAARAVESRATIVLQPGDHPEVSTETLNNLVRCTLYRPDQAIVPEFEGVGGHPILIPPCVAAVLVGSECPEGLGRFWTEHPKHCHRIAVRDRGVHRDVDTPADLAR